MRNGAAEEGSGLLADLVISLKAHGQVVETRGMQVSPGLSLVKDKYGTGITNQSLEEGKISLVEGGLGSFMEESNFGG